jgi:hypothetical protein
MIKVVCIKNKFIDKATDETLTIGKMYSVLYVEFSTIPDHEGKPKSDKIYYLILNDKNEEEIYSPSWFKTLDEVRDFKLNTIGIK